MKNLFYLLLFLLLPSTTLWANPKIRVACVGNSVTFGTRLKNPTHDAYPAQLQRMLGKNYEVRNFGRPNATLINKGPLPYILTEEYRKALAFQADLVIIHLGLNDTDPVCWPNYADQFIGDYRKLIDQFRKANPAAKIWICRMTPIFHQHKRFLCGTRDWHAQIQERIEQVARTYNVGLIDFYEPLHHLPHLFPDALHPNPEGARILAQKVYATLTGDFGGLKLPTTFGDGMVLQRQQPIVISGQSNAQEEVTVDFNGAIRSTHAQPNGRWKIVYPPQEAGGPYTLKVKAKSGKYKFKDVWVGEVWLCSGQSNMFFSLDKCLTAQKDLKEAASQQRLHLFNMPKLLRPSRKPWSSGLLDSINHLLYVLPGEWKHSNAESAKDFSAIGYHFGRILADSLQCHVGLICNAVGASGIESWVDRTTLENDFPNILYDWKENFHISAEVRNRAKINVKESLIPLQRHPNEPAYLFENAMLPLKDFAIRGVIWYQGEANADNIEVHERLFALWQKSWRNFFHQPQLPIYFVQLSSLNWGWSWPLFRDSQRRLAQSLPYTWMTVSSDLGHPKDIHPKQKEPIGRRLAHAALHHTYHAQHVVPSGPELIQTHYLGNTVQLDFKYAEGLRPSKGITINGFEVAGADGIYHPAEATLTGKGLSVSSPEVKEAQAVRYGWLPFTTANLVNRQGMPCSTFRDEHFQ